jgi:Domain of unknown function (DUF1737).
MKITDYAIVTGTSPGHLIGQVRKFIPLGWQPIGGLYGDLDKETNINEFFQAMVKYESTTPDQTEG